MMTRVICGALIGCLGLYDLYMYISYPENDYLWSYLIAGISLLGCSVFLFCSEDD